MALSKLQLIILTDKLEEILSTPNKYPTKDDYITDEVFEDMLCLVTDLDPFAATRAYQKIYEEADITMGCGMLEEIILKHIGDHLIK